MAGKTLIYAGAEADGLYRKEAGDSRWEKLANGMPPSPQVGPRRHSSVLRAFSSSRLFSFPSSTFLVVAKPRIEKSANRKPAERRLVNSRNLPAS